MIDALLLSLPPGSTRHPPADLAVMATLLKSKGFSVVVFDLNLKLARAFPDPKLWSCGQEDVWSIPEIYYNRIAVELSSEYESTLTAIAELEPAIIILNSPEGSLLVTIDLLHRLKQITSAELVVFGSLLRQDHPRQILLKDSNIYALIQGTPEFAALSLVEKAVKSKRYGIDAYRSLTVPILTKPVDNFDLLPVPTYEEFAVSSYDSPELPIKSNLACPYRCAYCNNPTFYGQVSCRSIESIHASISTLREIHGISRFFFTDPEINADQLRLTRWSGRVAMEDGVSWQAKAVARNELNKKSIALLAASGCRLLDLGFISGSARILSLMARPFRLSTLERVILECHEQGIGLKVSIMIGFPGETENDREDTLKFVLRHRQALTAIHKLAVCEIADNSPLALNLPDFGIFDPRPIDSPRTVWKDRFGSDIGSRFRDLRKMKGQLDSSGFTIEHTNLRACQRLLYAGIDPDPLDPRPLEFD